MLYICDEKGKIYGRIYEIEEKLSSLLQKEVQYDSQISEFEYDRDEEGKEEYISILEYSPSWDDYPTAHYWCVSRNGIARYSRDIPHIKGDKWEANNWLGKDADFDEQIYNDYENMWQTVLLSPPMGYCPNWDTHSDYDYWAVNNKNGKAYYYHSKPYYNKEKGVWHEHKENMQFFPTEDLEYAKAEKELVQKRRTHSCLANPNGKAEWELRNGKL